MNFTIFCFVLLFGSLIWAQDGGKITKTEEHSQARSCSPDMCELLQEFGAMREKLGTMETRLKESETRLRESEKQILDMRNKGTL